MKSYWSLDTRTHYTLPGPTFQLMVQSVKICLQCRRPPAAQYTWVRSLGWEDALEKERATHLNILVWEIHEQRSLEGYSPWGCKSQTRLSD